MVRFVTFVVVVIAIMLPVCTDYSFSQDTPAQVDPGQVTETISQRGPTIIQGPSGTSTALFTVVNSNGSTSGNGRAPQGSRLFVNSKYLISGAEMTASGFPNSAVTSIGWRWNMPRPAAAAAPVAQSVATTGNLKVFLKDTAASATGLIGTFIDTNGVGYTKIIDATISITRTDTVEFFVDVPAGGPGTAAFIPTPGNGVLVIFVYQTTTPLATPLGAPTVACLNSGALLTYQSQTVNGTTGTASAFRPHTRFGAADQPTVTNRGLLFPTPGVNTNYVQIPFQASMVGFGNNITIEAWVRPGGTTTANTVLNKGAASFDYQLGINATTSNPFFRAGTTIVQATTVTMTAGVWAHLAATYDGTTVRFYKDGQLVFSQAVAATLGSSVNEMRIGRGNADPTSGNLDEVRLWTVARTQGQIDSTKCRKYPGSFSSTVGLLALWHFDSTLVDSVSGFNGTILGNVTFDTLSLPCVTTSIVEQSELPEDYHLAQNYPNPFNPSTTIQFSLPTSAFTILRVYNSLGQEVAMLLNGQLETGTHTIQWRPDGLSSGVYFYRLQAGNFSQTKKLMLIK